MSATTFDTLSYTKGAEKIGIKREHAEYQAEQMAMVMNDQMVTKSYFSHKLKEVEVRIKEVEAKIKEAEMKIIIKVGAMMVVQSGLILTVMGLLLNR